MLNLSLEQRDKCCKVILQEYSIDEEFKSIIKQPILDYANSKLSERTLSQMLDKKMSIYSNVNTLKTNINIFSGYIYEFLCVYDYNIYRNKDHVLTILNPDTTSKTDLLHIINTKNGRIVVPGGDVKSGSSDYVLNQYEKLLETKYDIPFIDYSGYLTKDKHRLNKKQGEKLEKLYEKYPNKRPVEPTFSSEDINKIKVDILMYFETGYLPSERENHNVEFVNERYINSKESREVLVRLAVSRRRENQSINWSELREYASANWSWSEKTRLESEKSHNFTANNERLDYWRFLEDYEIENKFDIEQKLKKLKEKRATYNSTTIASNKSIINKFYKKSRNLIGKIIFDSMHNEQMTILQYRLDSRDFTQSVEEIYYEIEERKRLEKEREEEEERERYEQEEYYSYEFDDDMYVEEKTNIERASPSTHNVKSHTRVLRDGREISVRAYERGKRV